LGIHDVSGIAAILRTAISSDLSLGIHDVSGTTAILQTELSGEAAVLIITWADNGP
jgi:hypothetical protein